MSTPTYIIEDPELVKQICVKNFDSFMNHLDLGSTENDPLFNRALISMKDNEWKEMRSSLSPVFTGNKIRLMFELVKECADTMMKYCKNRLKKEGSALEINVKDLFQKSTVDVISACAFGVKIDSLKDPENPVFLSVKDFLDKGTVFDMIKFYLMIYFPKIAVLLRIKAIPDETTKFFTELITSTIKMRRKNKSAYKDIIDLLLTENDNKRQWSDIDIAAQCFDFIAAGLETTAMTLTFALYELAMNSDIERKLHEEIKSTSVNAIDYEKIQEFAYLDAFMSETLRKHPPGFMIDRMCNKEVVLYDEDGREITIEKDIPVWINVYGMHHNESHFPNPTKFDPERFLSSDTKVDPYCYLPFGKGPRACIGMRFALMEIKLILFHLLSHFSVERCERTPDTIQYTGEFTLIPDKDIIVKLKPRI